MISKYRLNYKLFGWFSNLPKRLALKRKFSPSAFTSSGYLFKGKPAVRLAL